MFVFKIEALLRDKVQLSRNGIKLMFKANDFSGQGVVSRHGLLRILFTLIGYINGIQFKILLKRYLYINKK